MNDRRLEGIIGQLLRAGVLLAAAIVTAGGVSYLVQHHSDQGELSHFRRRWPKLRTLPGIVESAARLDSAGLIQLGLLLLIATPVARVAVALVGFALERDRLYTVVSLTVLLILALSLIRAI